MGSDVLFTTGIYTDTWGPWPGNSSMLLALFVRGSVVGSVVRLKIVWQGAKTDVAVNCLP